MPVLPPDYPALVYGRGVDEEPFHEETNVRVLNLRAGLITLSTRVEPGQQLVLSASPSPVSTFLLSKDRLITWSLGALLREARDFRPPPNCSEVVHGSTLVHLAGYPS